MQTKLERRVFIVHGRNIEAQKLMMKFLRGLGLHPLEWNEALALTKDSRSPYIGDILDQAFRQVQAVLVLLTGDDIACLHSALLAPDDPEYERELTPQARPNVLFESGMAIGRYPERTILTRLGTPRPFSDVAGRYEIILDKPSSLRDLRQRLIAAGCRVRGRAVPRVDFTSALRIVEPATRKALAIAWSHDDAPTAKNVIEGAKNSLLLLGTSHYRIVTGDREDYRQWLRSSKKRRLGMLFLNPYSPHAFKRRSGFSRGNQDEILLALNKTLHLAATEMPNLIPLVYDGPYRYSARGIDLATHSAKPKITVFTSTHREGISRGFRVSVTRDAHPTCFAYYENELLHLWRSALANPPGHGISIVIRWPHSPNEVALLDAVKPLLKVRSSVFLFSPAQLHTTITSLCRTQSADEHFPGPLRVNDSDPAAFLPSSFTDFASQSVRILSDAKELFHAVTLSHIAIDHRGYITLSNTRGQPILSNVLQRIRDLTKERGDLNSSRFAPKYEAWQAHVTIGMAFREGAAQLPTPVRARISPQPLKRPLTFSGGAVVLVHYAYRSLLRTIGEIRLSTRSGRGPTAASIKAGLNL